MFWTLIVVFLVFCFKELVASHLQNGIATFFGVWPSFVATLNYLQPFESFTVFNWPNAIISGASCTIVIVLIAQVGIKNVWNLSLKSKNLIRMKSALVTSWPLAGLLLFLDPLLTTCTRPSVISPCTSNLILAVSNWLKLHVEKSCLQPRHQREIFNEIVPIALVWKQLGQCLETQPGACLLNIYWVVHSEFVIWGQNANREFFFNVWRHLS